MANKWKRPEGWEEIPVCTLSRRGKVGRVIRVKDIDPEERLIFEGGADTLLEALKEKYGTHVESNGIIILNSSSEPARFICDGTLVFIPDDKE